MGAILDKVAILENFMDDEELLFESIDLFLERVSVRMDTLKGGVEAKDLTIIMTEAHTLKGMIGIFGTGEAFEAAKYLELKGREKIIEGTEEGFTTLQSKVDLLNTDLKVWRSS